MIKENKVSDENISQSNGLQFLKINRSNSLNYFDEDSLIKLKLSLYSTLASIEEEIIGREINNFFDRVFPNIHDQYKVNQSLAKDYYEKFYYNSFKDQSGCKLLEDVKVSLDSIINKNYNMEFSFFQNYLEELSRVLVYSYLELSNRDYFSTSVNKNYKINTYKEFIRAVDKIVDKNVDVIKRYRDRDRIENGMSTPKKKNSICSNSTRCSFSSGSNYTYIYSTNSNEFEIPTEMIILLNKFQTIKTLRIFIPCKVEDLMPFIIILMNIEWLFPNLFEIELDFSMGPLHKELYGYFGKKMSNLNNKKVGYVTDVANGSNLSARKTLSRKSIKCFDNINETTQASTYEQCIKNHKLNFELLVIYSFFIAKMEKLKVLILIFPENFHKETLEVLKLSDVYLINFQFLNFLTPVSNLYQLSVDFNSLDTSSFEKVLSLFHKNNNLKSFKISLFTNESHYTTDALIKLCTVLNLNISEFYSKKKSFTNLIYESNELDMDVQEFILNKLLDSFEENLEKLFFILQTKMNLFEFHIKADLPVNVTGNESYIATFHKFIFNIFTLLNNENSSLQTFKLNFPFLSFDNRKYPGIGKFFDLIDLKFKQPRMYNFTILLHFNKILNINNIISTNLKFLHLGELDLDTFISFLKYFSLDADYRKMSKLTCLQITLSKTVFDPKKIIPEMVNFLHLFRPSNLRDFCLQSNLILNREDFVNLFKNVNNDRIEKYNFEFNKRGMNDYMSLFNNKLIPEFYYRLENKKLNTRIITILKSVGLNCNRRSFMEQKIFNNIQRYLEVYEKKSVVVTFNQ